MEEKGEEEVAEEAAEEDEKHSESVCPWEVARTAATFVALRPSRHCRLVAAFRMRSCFCCYCCCLTSHGRKENGIKAFHISNTTL